MTNHSEYKLERRVGGEEGSHLWEEETVSFPCIFHEGRTGFRQPICPLPKLLLFYMLVSLEAGTCDHMRLLCLPLKP